MKVAVVVDPKDAKAFQLLTREGETGNMPRSRYNYAKDVGDGLSSSIIVAVALWVARQFPEAPLAVADPTGELDHNHVLAQLWSNPNPWYGEGALRMAAALDYTINGNAYIEIGRDARSRRPVALYYQPSFQITAKGSDSELITHYEQATSAGVVRIEREDLIHFRNGLDPNDQKRGLAPLQSLLREVFTDDEAANATAAILRNLGIPGAIISPKNDDDEIGPRSRRRIRRYFRRAFRGDSRGEPLVFRTAVDVAPFNVDMAKLNIDKLRAIPEERATAVMGIPAAVVGFGTGLEQTKVGATMAEMRELAYENAIIPMQRNFAEELDRALLPQFETRPGMHVVFDVAKVRVLQEDENRRSDRITRQYQGGVILRSEARRALGHEATPADDVYRSGIADVLLPATGSSTAETRQLPGWVAKAITKDDGLVGRQRLIMRLLADFEGLAAAFNDELRQHFDELGHRMANAWLAEDTALRSRNGNTPLKADIEQADRALVDRLLLAFPVEAPSYDAAYLRVATSTVAAIDELMGLGVNLSDPLQQTVIAEGGTRLGLIDFDEQTRSAMYNTVAAAREEGLGPPDIARRIRERIPAGPWPDVETRAEVISRTETKHAQNVSSMEVYQRADTVTGVQVFDAQLGDTDDACMQINGRIFSLQDAAGVPMLEHPRCTRSFAPVVSEAVPAG